MLAGGVAHPLVERRGAMARVDPAVCEPDRWRPRDVKRPRRLDSVGTQERAVKSLLPERLCRQPAGVLETRHEDGVGARRDDAGGEEVQRLLFRAPASRGRQATRTRLGEKGRRQRRRERRPVVCRSDRARADAARGQGREGLGLDGIRRTGAEERGPPPIGKRGVRCRRGDVGQTGGGEAPERRSRRSRNSSGRRCR